MPDSPLMLSQQVCRVSARDVPGRAAHTLRSAAQGADPDPEPDHPEAEADSFLTLPYRVVGFPAATSATSSGARAISESPVRLEFSMVMANHTRTSARAISESPVRIEFSMVMANQTRTSAQRREQTQTQNPTTPRPRPIPSSRSPTAWSASQPPPARPPRPGSAR